MKTTLRSGFVIVLVLWIFACREDQYQLRFTPAERDGKRIAVAAVQQLDFELPRAVQQQQAKTRG